MRNLLIGLILGVLLTSGTSVFGDYRDDYSKQQKYNNEKAGDPSLYDTNKEREWNRQRFESGYGPKPC